MNANRQSVTEREASLRRVAIVLSSLPTPVAAKLLASFGQEKRMDLRRTMTTLSDVDPLERKRALESFSGSVQQMSDGTASIAGQGTDQLDVSATGLASGSATRIPSDAFSSSDEANNIDPHHPLAFLSQVPDPQLIQILTAEHPQTVAVVLASVDPGKAAQLIPGLPRMMRDEIIRRIGRMKTVEPEMLTEVAELLRAKCLRIDLPREDSSGSHALRAILARMTLPEESTDPNQGAGAAQPSAPANAPTPTDPSKHGASHSVPMGNLNSSSGHDRLALYQPSDSSDEKLEASLNQSAVDRIMAPADAGHGSTTPQAPSSTSKEGTNPPSLSTDDINRRLQSLSATNLCVALGRVGARDALLTLCGLPMKQANRAIAMLPKPQQKKTRAQLANLGPLQLSEIDRAKERVALASLSQSSALAAA